MYLPAKDIFLRELEKHFTSSYNLKKRVQIHTDIEMFLWKEDESVWKQKRDKAPKYYTVYFDDEFICGFSEADVLEKVMLEWWKGFKKAYKDRLVDLDEDKSKLLKETRRLELQAQADASKKVIDSLPDETPTQKLAKEVIRRVRTKAPSKRKTSKNRLSSS